MNGAQRASHMNTKTNPFGFVPISCLASLGHPSKWSFEARTSKLKQSICLDAESAAGPSKRAQDTSAVGTSLPSDLGLA